MKNHRIKHIQEMEALCAEVRPDDGIAPHVLKKQQLRENRESNRLPARALQYHKAVRQCLDAAFGNICADPLLTDLVVRSVEPMGKGSKLLIVVETPPSNPHSPPLIEATLQRAAGLLRSVVAGEVHRKRTPCLSFRVLPASAEDASNPAK
jgi:ribosome-binding factor A